MGQCIYCTYLLTYYKVYANNVGIMNNIQNELYGKPVVPPVIEGGAAFPSAEPAQPAEKTYDGHVNGDLQVVYPGLTTPEQDDQGENPIFTEESKDIGRVAVPGVITPDSMQKFVGKAK